MNDTCETMFVKNKGNTKDVFRINASDFDETKHTEYKGDEDTKAIETQPTDVAGNVQLNANPDFPPQPAPSAPDSLDNPATPAAPSPNQRFVSAKGKRFFAVDGQGTPLEIDGIDPKGYATDGEAWTAIMALPH